MSVLESAVAPCVPYKNKPNKKAIMPFFGKLLLVTMKMELFTGFLPPSFTLYKIVKKNTPSNTIMIICSLVLLMSHYVSSISAPMTSRRTQIRLGEDMKHHVFFFLE